VPDRAASGTERFTERFGREAHVAARAPGRVNLIGEHTDYSEGLVLPCAIDRDTTCLAAPRDDGRVRATALDLAAEDVFEVEALARRGGWIDYVQGVVFAARAAGHPVPGADLLVTSRVPRESGLSSSAALGVSIVRALDALFDWGLDGIACGRLAHHGESAFVGVGCGILDQFASALGREDHALRIDCRSQTVEPVAFATRGLGLLVVHSGVTRALADGAYLERVRACEAAVAAVAAARQAGLVAPDARVLRDLDPDRLAALAPHVAPDVFRRARHVVTENARVEAFCRAMAETGADAHARLGRLLAEGQASLRDDFEVSVPELDALCEIANRLPGVIGSRLTGAGWGGCSLHLLAADAGADIEERIADGFEAHFGRRPEAWRMRASAGASVERL